MTYIWTIVLAFSVISLITSNISPLIAGLILAIIGIGIEKFYQ